MNGPHIKPTMKKPNAKSIRNIKNITSTAI